MTDRLQELERIRDEVRNDPKNVSPETRKYFWKLVRQIKRETQPDNNEISVASEVRDILFDVNRGRTYPLGPSLAIMILLGLLPLVFYLWLLQTSLVWSNVLGWTLADVWQVVLRFLCVMGVVAFFYPLGRFIAGKVLGIRLLGMCRDEYYEPTIRIDYVTFLKATPPKRKWFFFVGGFWTVITSLVMGLMGLALAGDFTGFIPAVLLVLFEGYVVYSGNPSPTRGEMGHYNREKKIERVWRKRLAGEDEGQHK
ncbi:MAG: hypothetical protein ACFFD6_02785 [Candidatus Thorarchaeota archaeon]